jgi:phosphoribosylcarboxyaminoimidazole (NCAIR) mutase
MRLFSFVQMTSSTVPVLLVLADGVARNALHPTEELLQQFGVGYRQIALNECNHLAETIRAIIVASADCQAPAALSGSGIPVIRVPSEANGSPERGLSLLVSEGEQNTAGEGFATVAIGEAGAKNAALLVISMLAAQGDKRLRDAWSEYRRIQTETVLHQTLPA